MGRYKEAPQGFECPYRNACPHLGMSTTWASVLLSDVDNDSYRDGHLQIEAEKEIKALDEENRTLAARVAELEARLKQQHRLRFKRNIRKNVDPSAQLNDQSAGLKRKRGAPKGHSPWRRPAPKRVDRTVCVLPPTACPHCECQELSPSDEEHVQLQEDIVLQPCTVVTRYIHRMAHCPNCRRDVFQTADDELRNCEIGAVTKAAAVFLRHEVKLSYRDVKKVFSGLFGMPFVPASAMAFSHASAAQGTSLYEDLRNKIRAASIAHGDETHWRIDGQSAFLWYAGNEQTSFYHADYSRGSEVASAIFGSAFQGGLVADSYAAYNAVNPAARQVCLAHLRTKAKEIAERIELMHAQKQDAGSLRFCQSLRRFFALCCRLDQRRKKGYLPFAAAKAMIPRLQHTLNTICIRPLLDADAENLRQRITDPKRDAPNLFTFLKIDGMPPTKNHAEQALRLPVIFRKISFGSRSLRGASALAANLSLLGTAKKQKRNPIELFRAVLLKGHRTPLDALYHPDSIPKIDSS